MWPEDTSKTVLSKIYKDFYARGYINKKYVASDFKDKVVLLLLLEEVTKVYNIPVPEQITKAVQNTKEENAKYLASYDPMKLFKASEKYFVPRRVFVIEKFVKSVNNEKGTDEEKDKEKEKEEEEEDNEE